MTYSSNCQCGKVEVFLSLHPAIESLEPRECDCSFCKSYGLIYLSEPDGNLIVKAKLPLNQLRQGSEQATFWQCHSCCQIIAVTCEFDGELKGAVNGNLFAMSKKLKLPVIVSPRLLLPIKKRERWASAWMSVNFKMG